MAKKQSGGRFRTAAGAQAGERGVKKQGSKLKDLDVKSDRRVRGGAKAGTFEIKDFSFDVVNLPTAGSK